MKKLLFSLAFLIVSLVSFSQTSKADSIKQVQVIAAVNEIVNKTPIKEFQEWLYKNITAEKYTEFERFYNIFIERKYQEGLKPKKD